MPICLVNSYSGDYTQNNAPFLMLDAPLEDNLRLSMLPFHERPLLLARHLAGDKLYRDRPLPSGG